jgi:ATP-binding cassette subfamily B protein
MTGTQSSTEQLLGGMAPFEGLPAARLRWLAQTVESHRLPLGHTLLEPGEEPALVWILLEGSVRSFGPAVDGSPATPPRTLEKLGPGSILGWVSLLHRTPLEHLRTSTEVHALSLPAEDALTLINSEPSIQTWCAQHLPAAELYALLRQLAVAQDPQAVDLLSSWPGDIKGVRLWASASELPGTLSLDPAYRWFQSRPPQTPLTLDLSMTGLLRSQGWIRLIGLPESLEPEVAPLVAMPSNDLVDSPQPAGVLLNIADPPLLLPFTGDGVGAKQGSLELDRAAGPRDVPLVICLALASYFGVPANRDAIRDQIDALLQRQPQLNLINYGQLISSLSLRVVLSELPARQMQRVPTPAVLMFRQHVGLLDGIDRHADGDVARLLEPELGPVRIPVADLANSETGLVELLLIERRPDSKTSRFNWGWYGPYLKSHRRELLEVLATSAVVNTLALVTPLGLQVLIDQVAKTTNSSGALISISAVLLLSSLVSAVVRGLRSLIFTSVANRVDQATKSTILDQLVRLPQSFFDNRPVGQITFYFSQLDRVREFLISQSLTTVVDFGFSLLYIAVLLALNPLLTLVTLSTLPLFVALGLLSNPIVERLIERSVNQAIRTYSYLNEAITGIQTIKSQNAELKTRWEFQNRYARFIGEDFKLRVAGETITSLATFINDLNGLLVIGFGIYLVMQNQLSLGAFIAFRIISGYITAPLVKLVNTWQQFKQASQGLQIVGDVVDRTTEQTDSEATNIPMPPIQGHVQLRNVAFRFSDDAPRVLHNVNLEVPAGSFVGMVGGSGSGKSTVLKLLPRFYRPERGAVTIDGYDINKVELYSLRRQIGVVPQDSLLFDGTIKDNLLMVRPDATADDLIRAAKIACAHDFIMAMPQGYNSSVGERGAGLSGGQRQRMALARAVLQNPRMLILDEATSALDARTERQVCLNLFDAFRGRTVFFITHRLSTVRPADMIVLMDQGAVMEVGNHRQLMDQRGWYYALYQSQNQEGLG